MTLPRPLVSAMTGRGCPTPEPRPSCGGSGSHGRPLRLVAKVRQEDLLQGGLMGDQVEHLTLPQDLEYGTETSARRTAQVVVLDGDLFDPGQRTHGVHRDLPGEVGLEAVI